YDRIARNYAERNERMSPHWSERMEQFVDLLAQAAAAYPIPELEGRPGDDITLDEYLQFVPVLDAGCGTGRDARALAAHDLPILGVDLSQGMLDEAGERTARRLPHGSIRYALMDLRRLELPDTCCRGVWCSASLLHLPRRTAPRAVAELARVARRGAPLAIFLKRRREHEEPERFVPYEYADTPNALRFYAYYTEGEARDLVESAGLTLTDIATAPDPRFPEALGWVSLLATKS
ncbi:MAG: class I SAM-dependent methyltransferase, partial [Ktedonobacterales bacterium]